MPQSPSANIRNTDAMLQPLVEAMCHVLGNSCRISRLAATYQWNMAGPDALGAEVCFREQAEELHTALARIAEHIRTLGGVAVLDYSDTTLGVGKIDMRSAPPLPVMLEKLVQSHREACLSIDAALDLAEECTDRPSLHLLSDRLQAHRRHIWRATATAGHDVAIGEAREGIEVRRHRGAS